MFNSLSGRKKQQSRDLEAVYTKMEERIQTVERMIFALVNESAWRSRESLETRAQAASSEAKAYADQGLHAIIAVANESIGQVRETQEARIQAAGNEAKAYADQGLHVVIAAIGALAKFATALSAQSKDILQDRSAIAARLTECELAISQLAAHNTTTAVLPASAPR